MPAFFVFLSSIKSCSSSPSPFLKSFAKNGKPQSCADHSENSHLSYVNTNTQPSSPPDPVPGRLQRVAGLPLLCGFSLAVECRFHGTGQATQQNCTLTWSRLTTQWTTGSPRWSLRHRSGSPWPRTRGWALRLRMGEGRDQQTLGFPGLDIHAWHECRRPKLT